jgi:hypothetical protein
MKNRKTKLNDYVRSVIGTTFLGVGLLGSGAQVAQADPLVLPDANCGVTATSNCLTFQDFNVYSLGLLMEYQDIGLITDPTLNFLAKPNDGLIFIDRFNGNGTSLQGPGTNIDNPYDSLTGNLNNTGSGFNQDNLRFLMA